MAVCAQMVLSLVLAILLFDSGRFYHSPQGQWALERQEVLRGRPPLSIGWLPMIIPFLGVGTGRLLMLASVSDAGLFSVGRAHLRFRRYLDRMHLCIFDQFGSREVLGKVSAGRKFGGWIARSHRMSHRLQTCARRRNVSAHSRIDARSRLHQPKQKEKRRRRERQ